MHIKSILKKTFSFLFVLIFLLSSFLCSSQDREKQQEFSPAFELASGGTISTDESNDYNPQLILDSENYILVFYGSNREGLNNLYYAKSVEPVYNFSEILQDFPLFEDPVKISPENIEGFTSGREYTADREIPFAISQYSSRSEIFLYYQYDDNDTAKINIIKLANNGLSEYADISFDLSAKNITTLFSVRMYGDLPERNAGTAKVKFLYSSDDNKLYESIFEDLQKEEDNSYYYAKQTVLSVLNEHDKEVNQNLIPDTSPRYYNTDLFEQLGATKEGVQVYTYIDLKKNTLVLGVPAEEYGSSSRFDQAIEDSDFFPSGFNAEFNMDLLTFSASTSKGGNQDLYLMNTMSMEDLVITTIPEYDFEND